MFCCVFTVCLHILQALREVEEMKKAGEKGVVSTVSKRFNIPLSVLKRRVYGNLTVDSHAGRTVTLGEEEEKHLAAQCREMWERGFGWTREDIRNYALDRALHTSPDFKASDSWLDAFMNRHGLSLRVRSN